MRDLARLDEPTMYAMGFDRVTVKAFRTILDAVQVTLPDVVTKTDDATVTLSSLQLLVTTLQTNLALVESSLAEVQPPDQSARKIADLEARIDSVLLDFSKISRRVADLENGVN